MAIGITSHRLRADGPVGSTVAAARPGASWPALLTMAGIAILPIQLGVGGLSVRLAPADLCFGAAAVLLAASDRAPARRLLRLWTTLFVVVTWAVVVGTGRGSVLPAAMFDRWVGCVALLVAAFAAGVLDQGRLARALRAASWVTLAAHVVVALDPTLGDGRVAGRNAGFLVDPNNAGVLVACLLSLELARAVEVLRVGRSVGWVSGSLIAGLAWALVETGSRTAWFALGAGGLTLLVVNRDRLLVLVHRRILRFVVATVALVVVMRATLAAQFRSLQSRPDNIARRSEVLEQSWSSFIDHPLSGGGLLHTVQLGFGFPHNSLLWLLGDAGAIGLVAFAAVVVVPVRWLVVAGRRPDGQVQPDAAALHEVSLRRPVLCGLVTMTVSSIGIEALYQRQWWVLIGAAAGLSVVRRPVSSGPTRTVVS